MANLDDQTRLKKSDLARKQPRKNGKFDVVSRKPAEAPKPAKPSLHIATPPSPTIEEDFVSRALEIYTSLRTHPIKAILSPTREKTFWRYGEQGNQRPIAIIETLREHIIQVHKPIEDKSKIYRKENRDELQYDAFDAWHNEIHTQELEHLFKNLDKLTIFKETNAYPDFHYHARDFNAGDEVTWMPVYELMELAVHHNELRLEERPVPNVENTKREALLAKKLAEAKESGLYNAVSVYGVLEPILIMPAVDSLGAHEYEDYPEGYITDGHHRLIAAFDIDPEMLIPISVGGEMG